METLHPVFCCFNLKGKRQETLKPHKDPKEAVVSCVHMCENDVLA